MTRFCFSGAVRRVLLLPALCCLSCSGQISQTHANSESGGGLRAAGGAQSSAEIAPTKNATAKLSDSDAKPSAGDASDTAGNNAEMNDDTPAVQADNAEITDIDDATIDLGNPEFDAPSLRLNLDMTVSASPAADAQFIVSSIQYAQRADGSVIIGGDDAAGNVRVFIASNGNFKEILTEPQAQLSCFGDRDGGFGVAFISRRTAGKYILTVRNFDGSGNEIANSGWTAKTRGFIPDPGSRCAFFNNKARKIYVTGTRPRGEKAPDRGLFVIEPNKLTHVEGTETHVPQIDDIDTNDDGRLIVRQVIKIDGKPHWPHVLYKIQGIDGENSKLTAIPQAIGDVILFRRAGGGYDIFNPSHCRYASDGIHPTGNNASTAQENKASGGEKSCNPGQLTFDARNLHPLCGADAAHCYSVLTENGESIIAKPATSQTTYRFDAKDGLKIYPIAVGDAWTAIKLDDKNRDRGRLHWVRFPNQIRNILQKQEDNASNR